MALNISYTKDKFEGEVDEGFRSLYTERDGNFVLTGITGIKTDADVAKLQKSLTDERADHKKTKDRLRPLTLNGHSVVEMSDDQLKAVVEELDSYDELKAKAASAGKTDDEKINQLVEQRIKGKLAPLERERDKYKGELAASLEQVTGFQAERRQRTIHDAIRRAANETKVGKFKPTAIDDALMLAERIFEMDDSGNVTVKDQVGFTPGLKPEDWIAEVADKRAHWFEDSQGGGAKGGRGGNGGGANPWKKESFNLTEQGKITRDNPERAKQLAAAAN